MSADEKDGGKAEQRPGGGFTVTDRRIFADDKGTARVEEPPGAAKAAAPEVPTVDFHTFVLSLGSSALMHLGELERPGAGGAAQDLPMAKHTIDILAMLEEKTKGNLSPAEAKLMESLLYDLRLRYVEISKEPPAS
jgi:Domain of unknown function (DUF1844)